MKYQIKSRLDASILFECETGSLKLCVEAAVATKAGLHGADLGEADLGGAKNAQLIWAKTVILPEGDIVGWKSCRDNVLVKLRIPVDAKRSNATWRKCRAEFVDVLEVIGAEVGYSKIPAGGEKLEYRVGQRVRCVQPFDTNRWNECSSGIHFYITREEAEND